MIFNNYLENVTAIMRLLEESLAMLLEKLEFDSVNQEQLKYIKVQFHAILSAACVSRSQFFFGALRAQANEKKMRLLRKETLRNSNAVTIECN